MTFLDSDKLGIGPIGSNPIGVGSAGDHLPPVDHGYAASREDGREPVCNDQGCAPRHQAGHGGLEQPLVLTFEPVDGSTILSSQKSRLVELGRS